MASLPSFVQLMASLGLSDRQPGPSTDVQRTDSIMKSAPSRSVSSPALREAAARQYTSRYSPYSPSVVCIALDSLWLVGIDFPFSHVTRGKAVFLPILPYPMLKPRLKTQCVIPQ
jgi:hypothetical protein